MEEGQASRNPNSGGSPNDDRTIVTTPPQILRPPPSRPHHDNTYIVQFPKDQVYRVPPQENAMIVERYRNPPKEDNKKKNNKRRGCSCPRIILTLVLILITIIAVFGITFSTLFFIFNPTGPTFTVTNFVVKNPTNSTTTPQYEVSLRAKNPNEMLGIVYQKSELWLLFEKNKVATGMFPRVEQRRNAENVVKVGLMGTNGGLPKRAVQSEKPVNLDLGMRVGVRINAQELNTWIMKACVVCKFQVSSLGNDTRLLSQECDTNFKQY